MPRWGRPSSGRRVGWTRRARGCCERRRGSCSLAVALGVPGLFAGGPDLLRGRRALATGRLLAFFGPLLVLVGTELLPHVLGCPLLPWTCEDHPRHGWTIADQWHQLDHVLVGGVPLVALYSWALFLCHPAVACLPRRRGTPPMGIR